MSVYRKPTFTGLGLSFFSFIPFSIKKAVIHSAIYRAFRISSTYSIFHVELNFIRNFFRTNGFPNHLIEAVTRSVLDKLFSPKSPTLPTVAKLDKYIVLPYFGAKSINLQKDIIDLLGKFYPYLNPKVVLRNRFTISSLFNFKDRIPKCLRSGIVYKYSCSSCGESYIGSTYVRLYSRVCEHKGISDRNQKMLLSPKNSSVRDHSHECDTPFSIEDFTILDSEPFHSSLRLLESLYIHEHKPKINGNSSSYPLSVVRLGSPVSSAPAPPPPCSHLSARHPPPPCDDFDFDLCVRERCSFESFNVSAIATSACDLNIYFILCVR